MAKAHFEWDPVNDDANQAKHGVAFSKAQHAFADPQRVIAKDESHSQIEEWLVDQTQVFVGSRKGSARVWHGSNRLQ